MDDPEAAMMRVLYDEHAGALWRYVMRLTGDAARAEDVVQETLLRAWKNLDRFEGRSALRSWLYKIATNVCLDQLEGRERRARPMDLGPAGEPVIENLGTPEVPWLQPVPDSLVADPAETVASRETIRLAFVAALPLTVRLSNERTHRPVPPSAGATETRPATASRRRRAPRR